MNKEKLVNLLKIKRIPYKIYEHEPLFTVNESKKLRGIILVLLYLHQLLIIRYYLYKKLFY